MRSFRPIGHSTHSSRVFPRTCSSRIIPDCGESPREILGNGQPLPVDLFALSIHLAALMVITFLLLRVRVHETSLLASIRELFGAP